MDLNSFENRRLTFTELLYGVLLQPRITFKKIAQTTPLFHSLLIFAGVNIISTLVGIFTVSEPTFSQTMSRELPLEFQGLVDFFASPAFTSVGTLMSLIFSLFLWFFMSSILHLFAEIFGGKGRALGVLTVLGCASLPQILIIPFEVLFYLLRLPSGVLIIISIPLLFWSQIILPILGLRDVHQFSLGRAVLTFLTPMLLCIGLIIILFGTFIALMASFLG